MISAAALDFNGLQSVSLEGKGQLPNVAAVYFAIDADSHVLYVGTSRSLKSRWSSHHLIAQLKSIGSIRIAWLEINNEFDRKEAEAAYIRHFRPRFNLREEDGKKSMIASYFTQEVAELIVALAARSGISVSKYTRQAIYERIERDTSNPDSTPNIFLNPRPWAEYDFDVWVGNEWIASAKNQHAADVAADEWQARQATEREASFSRIVQYMKTHECSGLTDVCTCIVHFDCVRCGKSQTVSGESMPQMEDIGGLCERCYYEVDFPADGITQPLDTDYAAYGFEA